jgi:hypothetical protein
LLKLTINGKIPVGAFRDEKVTKLNLKNQGYKAADGIIIASLLKVLAVFDVMENLSSNACCLILLSGCRSTSLLQS